MREERNPVPRAQNPWGWLGGILALGVLMAGAVAGALALWENVDIQRLTRAPGDVQPLSLPDPVSPSEPARSDGGFGVALYASEATARYFPEQSFYPSILEGWEALIRTAGGSPRRVASAAEVLALGGEGLIVAPSAVCLGNGEIQALRAHVQRGGGLLLTWATGARNEDCEWRGWDVVQEFSDAADVRELESRDGLFFTVPSGLPLSGGIEPAARVELRWNAPLAVATAGPRVYWSDWALNPAPASGTETVDGAAVLRAMPNGGRVVWFGFTDDQGVTGLDNARVRQLLTNGLIWGAGLPTAELLPWPDGHRAAFVFAQEVGGELPNAERTAEIAAERGVPATSFVVSGLASVDQDLAAALTKAGEIASQTTDNSRLVGLPRAEQETRLGRSVSEIADWSGVGPLGLRAPEEAVDAETLAAWRSLGGTYVVGLNNGRTGSPEIFDTGEGRIVLLPRVIKDDYNLLVQDRLRGTAELTSEFLAGIAKVRSIGGLAVMTVSDQLAGLDRYSASISATLDSVRAQEGWWLARGSEVAEWSAARAEASVRLVGTDGRVEVEVAAPARFPLAGAWIHVALPESASSRGGSWVSGETGSWAGPVSNTVPVSFGDTRWGIVIPVPDLAPGETHTIVIEKVSAPVLETGL